MEYISTRSIDNKVTLDTAITQGLASDGGLFVPTELVKVNIQQFSKIAKIDTYVDFAYQLLHPYFTGSTLKPHLLQMCQAAFDFPIPLKRINENTLLLALFHGPTLSFKDFGARFLAQCLAHLSKNQKRTIMVATSGDTGSAVASAFYKKENLSVVILFPKGKISPKQEQQLTCWNSNVTSIAVKGRFDDCQRMVKAAFNNPDFKPYHLTSANSINIARLLPQVIYYAYSSLKLENNKANFIVPSGNLGHVTAAFWAKAMGFPIGKIQIACNANRTVPDYVNTGHFDPRPGIHTLANAMDVGNPSNFERLAFLFKTHETFKKNVEATSVSDKEIKKAIKAAYEKDNIIICPHTATAYYLREKLSQDERWIIVGTADPSKFETVIEPLLKVNIPIPEQLEWMLTREPHFVEIKPDLKALNSVLKEIQ